MKKHIFLILCTVFTYDLSAQGLIKNGQSTIISTDFVNKNGKIGNGAELNKNGKIMTVLDIDGNLYHTIPIGTQIWMLENLQTTKLNDGTAIQMILGTNAWSTITSPAYCWYNDNPDIYKEPYGALYNWIGVNTGKLCPIGWHVPSDSEWSTLNTSLNGESLAGGKLKETGTAHWWSPNTGATNETGFTALPGGHRSEHATANINALGYWWSSTSTSPADFNTAYSRIIKWDNSENMQSDGSKNSDGFSVRCLKDY